MKRILLSALTLLTVVACSKFDDSEIWSELKDHEERIVKLETLCNQLNTNITSLQTIIIALQNNDYVTNIAPIKEGNKEIGYTITFAKSGSITIYHGKDGENGKDGVNGSNGKDGKDGADGKDGKDGYTPKISVKQHTDGRYYWTLDGTWLLDDNGNMIPATGEDGKDGTNGSDGKDGEDGKDGINGTDGKDGITPLLKIEDGYWYLSYDDGATWQKLGKATGNNGLDGIPGADGADGEDGDSIIDSITQDNENVYFNLSDGTLITLPKRNIDTIIFEDLQVKAICCKNWDTNYDGELSYSEARSVSDISTLFKGNTYISAFTELQFFTGLTSIADNAFKECTNLWKIKLPDGIQSIGEYAFSKTSIYSITVPNSVTDIQTGAFYSVKSLQNIDLGGALISIGEGAFYGCALNSIDFPETLVSIGEDAFYDNNILSEVTIPKNVTSFGNGIFESCDNLTHVYCMPENPPVMNYYSGYACTVFKHPDTAICIIYVPSQSVEAYKSARGWKEYKTRIFAMNK